MSCPPHNGPPRAAMPGHTNSCPQAGLGPASSSQETGANFWPSDLSGNVIAHGNSPQVLVDTYANCHPQVKLTPGTPPQEIGDNSVPPQSPSTTALGRSD